MNTTTMIRNLNRELEAISHAVIAADEAHLRNAIESVHWQRRGRLGRLARVERHAEPIKHRKLRDDRLVA